MALEEALALGEYVRFLIDEVRAMRDEARAAKSRGDYDAAEALIDDGLLILDEAQRANAAILEAF